MDFSRVPALYRPYEALEIAAAHLAQWSGAAKRSWSKEPREDYTTGNLDGGPIEVQNEELREANEALLDRIDRLEGENPRLSVFAR